MQQAHEQLPPGGEPIGEDPPWAAWTPPQVAERLAGIDVPWAVAAGWALDLFRRGCEPGHRFREHEDLEIAVPQAAFPAVRSALADLEVDVVGSGRRWPLDSPAHEVMHQTWFRGPDGVYVLDVFREPHDGDTWICRRDPSVRRPYRDLVHRDPAGIPYVAPEVVLLFKALHVQRLHARAKDEQDFAGTLPLLSAAQRGWLAEVLERVHPGHRWLREPGLRPDGSERAQG